MLCINRFYILFSFLRLWLLADSVCICFSKIFIYTLHKFVYIGEGLKGNFEVSSFSYLLYVIDHFLPIRPYASESPGKHLPDSA